MPSDTFDNEIMPHTDNLLTYAIRLTQDRNLAEDLVQDTLVNAWKAIGSFKPETSGKAWLFTICRNLFFTDFRKKKSQPKKVSTETIINVPDNSGSEIIPDKNGNIYDDEVINAINKLTENQRELLILFLEDFSYAEMAEITQTELNTVRSRLKRGKDNLAISLMKYAVEKGFA
jgi:RNA polymerase sigma-70 factor, ECF subfamily